MKQDNWIITDDVIQGVDNGTHSVNFDINNSMNYKFRLIADNEKIIYQGLSTDFSDSPLIDFGLGKGCARIEYLWELTKGDVWVDYYVWIKSRGNQ